MKDMEKLMEQALDGVIYCPKCDNGIEPDAEKCICGWKNPLIIMGMI